MKSLLFILLLVPSLSFAQHKVAPDFSPSGEWFNSEPLHISDLKGKVVMVEMWTFACNNSYNSIPTLQNFYSKYNSQGFEIVGVHTPEFDYEKEAGNVAEALIKHEVTWPVFQDNDFTTWRAYDIHAWPPLFW
jgi:thiol-disulfide isomerase/thioredoxin